ncbi:MAG: hypothetical protein RLY31_1454 [Bacteroidota bacterium]
MCIPYLRRTRLTQVGKGMTYEQEREQLLRRIQGCGDADFAELALAVFRFQLRHNELYARYCSLLKVAADKVGSLEEIPYLPIQLFRQHRIRTGEWKPVLTFSSSGTTGGRTSYHDVRDPESYRRNARRGFRQFYGDPAEYLVLALLPSYLERSGSSLVHMAADFIACSRYPESGFFLENTAALRTLLESAAVSDGPGRPRVLLLGVSFALLDLAEQGPLPLADRVLVMETGGMKGRRREMIREELHGRLQEAFGVPAIHSEYGMTELFSQAYSKGAGRFLPSALLRVSTRELTDPLSPQQPGKTGAVNVIDLANLDTCSFLATEDLGKVWEDGGFEILGRVDNSDIRGCNLMV